MQVAVIVGFLALQLAIGAWAARRVHSESDYFVAGRSLGPLLLTMSLFATWFGAESCLGSSGAIYTHGLSGARADPLGYTLCLLLLGLFLAGRFVNGRHMTLGDLYRERFGPGVERLAIALLVPSSLIWGAAQIRALGQVVADTGGLPTDWAVVLAGLLVIGYAFLGGLWGDVATDLIQGVFLVLGLVGLLVVVLVHAPPTRELSQALSAERLSLFPAGESVWVQLDRISVPVLGSLVTQEVVARLLGARSAAVARRSALIASGLYLVVGAVPVVLGLLGPALIPHLQESETLLPRLAEQYLGPPWSTLFACALLAAILSTVDSVLLSNAALLSHNLLGPALRLNGPRQRLWLGRFTLLGAGLVALVVAVYATGIYELVELASSLGTAGVLIITLAALFWPQAAPRAALGALLVGGVATPLLRLAASPAPYLLSVGLAALTFLLLQLGSARPAREARSPLTQEK